MTLVLSITIKIALLTLGALVATALLHRRSAAVRHWILATTLFCSVCVPAVELLVPAWAIPLPAAWQTSSATSSLRFVSGSTSVENARPAVGDATFASPVNAIPVPDHDPRHNLDRRHRHRHHSPRRGTVAASQTRPRRPAGFLWSMA